MDHSATHLESRTSRATGDDDDNTRTVAFTADWPAAFAAGRRAFREGDVTFAEAELRRAMHLALLHGASPNDVAQVTLDLGRLWNELGRIHEVSALVERALALEPGPVAAGLLWELLAYCCHSRGDLASAEARYRMALTRLQPHAATRAKGRCLHNLGVLLIELGRDDEAEQMLRRAILGRHHNAADAAATVHELGWLVLGRGYVREAEALLHRALFLCESAGAEAFAQRRAVLLDLAVLYQDIGKGASARLLRARARRHHDDGASFD